jgi:diacylglycerol kinase (ATP)
VVVLFGGDGTIHRHLPELVSRGLPALIVPVGSGNDFARALGLRSVRHALTAWRRFCAGARNIRAIDVGVITSLLPSSVAQQSKSADAESNPVHYFCSVAGVGLDCEVARRANMLPPWFRARGGYALSLISMLFRFAPLPIKILTVAGTGWTNCSRQSTILAAFANTSTYGGGMKIAPRAKMDDGQLDICVVGGVDPFKLFCLFPTVYFGRHIKIQEVDYFQSAQVRVETGRPLDVYADGEYVCRTPIEISLQHQALQVIVHSSQTAL